MRNSLRSWSACAVVALCLPLVSGVACSSSESKSSNSGTGATGPGPSAGGASSSSGGATTDNGGSATGNGGAPAGGSGAPGSSGGTVAAGGAAAGGTVNLGGQSSASTLTIVGSVTKCPDATEPPAKDLNACSIEGCTGAHCVAEADLAPGSDKTMLATCSAGVYCVPDDFIVTSGKYLAKSCTSLEGAEGRCLSTCIPDVNKQMKQLPQDVCADSERCTPCFNPVDGEDTKACTQGCDTGPNNKTPVLFDKCGYGRGVCVPPKLVPEDLKTALANVQDGTCAKKDADGNAYLCAPADNAKDMNHKFPACTSTSVGFGFVTMTKPDGQKGACVPHFLVKEGIDVVLVANPDPCKQPAGADPNAKSEDLCAPCYDTSMPPAETGACN